MIVVQRNIAFSKFGSIIPILRNDARLGNNSLNKNLFISITFLKKKNVLKMIFTAVIFALCILFKGRLLLVEAVDIETKSNRSNAAQKILLREFEAIHKLLVLL